MPLTPLARARRERRESGVILVVVLVFALLLTGTIATFLRRATVDSMISRNRDAAARAEALARGGVRLATVLLLEDKLRERQGASQNDTRQDLWAKIGSVAIPLEDGSMLRLRVEDAGTRLNLNAVIQFDENGAPHSSTLPLLEALLEKVIEELPILPGERALYDPVELAANLVDYVDDDDLRQRGGYEDDLYQQRTPPQRPANRPLLSVNELRAVEGFDAVLVDGLRPYVGVHPFAGDTGINLNTAPPHVLSLLYADDGVDLRLVDEDTVRDLLKVRQEDRIVCGEGSSGGEDSSGEACTPMNEVIGLANEIFPPPTFESDVFTITAEVRTGEIRRAVEAVVDLQREAEPLLLSWRVL